MIARFSIQIRRKISILTLTDNVLKPLIEDLSAVFKDADSENLMSKSLIPSKFHESDPNLINQNYEIYIEENPKASKLSIADKLAKHDYHSPYQLYHDVKLVAGHEISQLAVGSEQYNNIDFFFKFATELLLREVGTLGLKLKEDSPEDEILSSLTEEFEKISSSYSVTNGEVITQVHKYEEPVAPAYHSLYGSQPPPATKTIVQPLFSGLVGRSALDSRNTVVPDPYQLAKVVGTPKVMTSEATLGGFSSRIPPPSQAPTQVLDSFFHPNWYTIEAPKWLIYKQKTLKPPVDSTLVKNVNSNDLRVFEKQSHCVSFGPLTDLRGSVLSEELRTSVWLNHIGLKKIEEIRREYLASKDGIDEDEEMAPVESAPDAPEEDEVEAKKEQDTPETAAATDGEIKIENIVRFVPETLSMLQLLKSEKDELLKSPAHVQKVISSSLLKLNKLRQDRYLRSGSNAPTSAEVSLYKKIVKLTSLLVSSEAAKGGEFALKLSKRLPVLVNEYQGVLPAPLASKIAPVGKSARLPGIRGPYKKKNRYI